MPSHYISNAYTLKTVFILKTVILRSYFSSPVPHVSSIFSCISSHRSQVKGSGILSKSSSTQAFSTVWPHRRKPISRACTLWHGSFTRNTERYIVKIPWWRHQMETFSASLTLCEGNSPSPVNFPHKGQWRGALMFLWSAPEQTIEQTIETPVIWDAIAIIMAHSKVMTLEWHHVSVMATQVTCNPTVCWTIYSY